MDVVTDEISLNAEDVGGRPPVEFQGLNFSRKTSLPAEYCRRKMSAIVTQPNGSSNLNPFDEDDEEVEKEL